MLSCSSVLAINDIKFCPQSTASPHDTMIDVLKVFESLNVRWKKIGNYNMRCLLLSQFSTYSKPATVMDGPPIKDIYGNELIITRLSSKTLKSHDAVKFEIQVISYVSFVDMVVDS